ncbi:ATP-binding cassette domain-containing protein [Lactiplantibacillus paraplantarum]|uniref:ATP-binding cassette domain-containing protein n=1 Tax=Lactiplantibacillus paraplantarum TaxID=60520 RepID=UPI0021CFF28D|nr:ATP-binding cassette domain-containing protein [Lactiplantibacillus paraplantarum]MCU4683833.1 ATP-binding cassette domain-containing protein [Lactiplantibacillus paraplantarum]
MSEEMMIQMTHVQKRFGAKVAVKDLSLQVQRGEIFGLLGPNGAGKTTTIKMLTTLLRQDAGKIIVNGFDSLSQAQRVRQQFGLTGQTASIDQDLSARENLQIFGRLNGLSRVAAKTRATELLADFDLTQSADHVLATFSGGMRRLLDLAVSLIGKPAILFLDEPTTGLDPRTRTQMWQAIRQLVAAGSTVVLTTQYLEEADQLADHIALIDHGQLVASGTPTALKQSIGGQELELQVSTTAAVASATNILQAVLGQNVQVEARTLTVPLGANSLTTVAEVLTRLQAAQITVSNFAMHTPSLDDVFLKLTVGTN